MKRPALKFCLFILITVSLTLWIAGCGSSNSGTKIKTTPTGGGGGSGTGSGTGGNGGTNGPGSNGSGGQLGEYEGTSGSMQFIALVPSGYQHGGNPVPLMVSFHGAGDNHKNFFANTQLKPVAEQNSFIYVCPKSATGNAWSVTDDAEMSAVVSLVDWFKTNYNIDTSRIYTHGFSRGGQFAPYICFKRSGVFAGFFENSGGMPGGGQVSGVCAGFCIHAQDDQAVPIGYSEDLVQKMEAAGNPVDYRWKSSGGHTVFPEFYQEAWDYLYSHPRQ